MGGGVYLRRLVYGILSLRCMWDVLVDVYSEQFVAEI